VSGWLVGLPFTSAPVAFFLARDHGVDFAASAAAGTMAGGISQAAFCVAYARLAGRAAWPLAVVGGCAAFALATVALAAVRPGLPVLAAVVLVSLLGAWRLMPADRAETAVVTPPPAWDLPARMTIATAFVVVLTGLAGALGPRLTGLLAPFPLYAAILTVFAHALDGGAAAARVLRGLLLGLVAFAAFFLVLAATLAHGIAPAFALATLVALALQAASLGLLRRHDWHRPC
jgi:hypothetical protein